MFFFGCKTVIAFSQYWAYASQVRGSAANYCFRYLKLVRGCAIPPSIAELSVRLVENIEAWDSFDSAVVQYLKDRNPPRNCTVLLQEYSENDSTPDEAEEMLHDAMSLLPTDVLLRHSAVVGGEVQDVKHETSDHEEEAVHRMQAILEPYQDGGYLSVSGDRRRAARPEISRPDTRLPSFYEQLKGYIALISFGVRQLRKLSLQEY